LLPRFHPFLADCTNGRAYATVLRPSVVCNVYVVWLNGASGRKTVWRSK